MRCLNLIRWIDGVAENYADLIEVPSKLRRSGKFFPHVPSCIATISKQLPSKSYVPEMGMQICSKLSRSIRALVNRYPGRSNGVAKRDCIQTQSGFSAGAKVGLSNERNFPPVAGQNETFLPVSMSPWNRDPCSDRAYPILDTPQIYLDATKKPLSIKKAAQPLPWFLTTIWLPFDYQTTQ